MAHSIMLENDPSVVRFYPNPYEPSVDAIARFRNMCRTPGVTKIILMDNWTLTDCTLKLPWDLALTIDLNGHGISFKRTVESSYTQTGVSFFDTGISQGGQGGQGGEFTIMNGGIYGDYDKNVTRPYDNEHCHGIFAYRAPNLTRRYLVLDTVVVTGFAGDGVYVSNTHLNATRTKASYCGRNGFTVTILGEVDLKGCSAWGVGAQAFDSEPIGGSCSGTLYDCYFQSDTNAYAATFCGSSKTNQAYFEVNHCEFSGPVVCVWSETNFNRCKFTSNIQQTKALLRVYNKCMVTCNNNSLSVVGGTQKLSAVIEAIGTGWEQTPSLNMTLTTIYGAHNLNQTKHVFWFSGAKKIYLNHTDISYNVTAELPAVLRFMDARTTIGRWDTVDGTYQMVEPDTMEVEIDDVSSIAGLPAYVYANGNKQRNGGNPLLTIRNIDGCVTVKPDSQATVLDFLTEAIVETARSE